MLIEDTNIGQILKSGEEIFLASYCSFALYSQFHEDLVLTVNLISAVILLDYLGHCYLKFELALCMYVCCLYFPTEKN